MFDIVFMCMVGHVCFMMWYFTDCMVWDFTDLMMHFSNRRQMIMLLWLMMLVCTNIKVVGVKISVDRLMVLNLWLAEVWLKMV